MRPRTIVLVGGIAAMLANPVLAAEPIRIADLLNEERFAEKLKENLEYHNHVLVNYLGADPIDFHTTYDDAMALVPRLRPMVADVSSLLYAAHKEGGKLLFEGAQGSLLDVDHGTYPFVTSSNTVAGQAATGAGTGPTNIGFVLGITKAYTTRVGSGPFPAEWTEWTEPESGSLWEHDKMSPKERKSQKEQQEELIALLKKWQKLEESGIALLKSLQDETDNVVLKDLLGKK